MTDHFGLYDTSVQLAPMNPIGVYARMRWEEALDNSVGAWNLADSTNELFIETFRTVERENLRDAAVLADAILAQAKGDKDALKGDCECGVYGPTCAKCVAYARVMAWYRGRAQ
jgi:hypothetical protein